MISYLCLGIRKMEIDWGKYNRDRDFSFLFREGDLRLIPIYTMNPAGSKLWRTRGEGFSCKLRDLKLRLDLLGYDLDSLEAKFNEILVQHEQCERYFPFYFGLFYKIIYGLDLRSINTIRPEFANFFDDFYAGEFVENCVINSLDIPEMVFTRVNEDKALTKFFLHDACLFLENLDPLITLRILAENPANQDLNVQWDYSELLNNAPSKRNQLRGGAKPEHRIIIATERAETAYIIEKAIAAFYPEISDFFIFIDTETRSPFPGTSSLIEFCEALTKVNYLGKILAIFDNNSAAAVDYRRAELLKRPRTFVATRLPNHPSFCEIQTIGAEGEAIGDINARAVTIECFLDFQHPNLPPVVQWTEYIEQIEELHGELLNKNAYVEAFKQADLKSDDYDSEKLKYLVDYLLNLWITSQRYEYEIPLPALRPRRP